MIKSYFRYICFFVLALSSLCLVAQESDRISTAYFSLDDCDADPQTGENRNYSEFTPAITNGADGLTMSIDRGHLFKERPNTNAHSCTPGINGGTGLCFGGSQLCEYQANLSRPLKIDVRLTAGDDGFGWLTDFSFFEKSASPFVWINGGSGPNNYPTQYAIRILKNGEEIYRNIDNPTSEDWTEETFDFSDDPNFLFEGEALFTIEMAPYCPVGNLANPSIWDIDEIYVGALSVPIDGGELDGGPFEFCAGNGDPDFIVETAIRVTENEGSNQQWVVTDADGDILGLPDSPYDVDFDGAGAGNCLIYLVAYEGPIEGLAMGENIGDLVGFFDLSNSLTVTRNQPEAGFISGGPFEFCVGNGGDDRILPGAVRVQGNSGESTVWVTTDADGNILGSAPEINGLNFDGAGEGTCLVYLITYDGPIGGLSAGRTLDQIVGCFAISNSIEVIRTAVIGGTLNGGPFEFCAGNGVPDMIVQGAITLSGESGEVSQWVVTDSDGNILGLPDSPFDVDFDGAGDGACLVYHMSYNGPIGGLIMGNNIETDLVGCFHFSNPIEVVRNDPDGGIISGGPFTFCAGNGDPDMIVDGAIDIEGAVGELTMWVVTDSDGIILGHNENYANIDFDGAGPGTCLLYLLKYSEPFSGLAMGRNINTGLIGCFGISNSIEVIRTETEGGTLAGGPFEFCAGDGEADMLPDNSLELTGADGENMSWVVTDSEGFILGLPASPYTVDFDGAGDGVCRVYNISYTSPIGGLNMGRNISDLVGCFDLSNGIDVVRNYPDGGTLVGGPFQFCAGNGDPDMIVEGAINVSGVVGSESQWIVTDSDGNILGLPDSPYAVDFDGAGAGACLVYHLSSFGDVSGLDMDANVSDLAGCFDLSNGIEVVRLQPEASILSGGPFEFCADDGEVDMIMEGAITSEGGSGSVMKWIVTDANDVILGLPGSPYDVDFDVAGAGDCNIYQIHYEEPIGGLAMGASLDNLVGCFAISNALVVTRNTGNEGACAGGIANPLFEISLAPNPTSEKLIVDLNKKQDQTYTIEIYDQFGNQAMRVGTQSASRQELDISNLMPGNYILVVRGNLIYESKRFLVIR